MRRVGIRELSADVIRNCARDNEALGVASKGALIGVLLPLTHEILQRLMAGDADGLAAKAANPGIRTNLRDVLQDPGRAVQAPAAFSRMNIRKLSGARLAEASSTNTPIVITIDRTDIAVFLPMMTDWVDRLVEENVQRFLDGGPTAAAASSGQTHSNVDAMSDPARASGRRFTMQRAIGIRIVGDSRRHRERIVGVVTDGLARIKVPAVTLPLKRLDEAYVLEQILSLIDILQSEIDNACDLVGVGIEIGGHVSQGRVVHSTNIHWDQFPVADQLSEIIDLPVVLENDANALAIYERYFEGISTDHFAVVLITHLGIGCGLVLDGRLHRGSRGMAAELGHIPVMPAPALSSLTSERTPVLDGRSIPSPDPSEISRCRCGNPDCLECVATPQAIEAMLHTNDFAGTYEDALRSSDNPAVRDVFALAGATLGNGIVTLLNLLNPEAVVLYGPLDLVGPPRQFHIENFNTVTDAKAVSGVGRIYTGAMVENIRNHVFSNAAETCQFIVRIRSDEQGARAAAACVIRAIRDRSEAHRQGRISIPAKYGR